MVHMEVKILGVDTDDEDFGPYLWFELPEFKFKGFINIEEWYATCKDDFCDVDFEKRYEQELLQIIEKWVNDKELIKFKINTYPSWSDIPSYIAGYIYGHRFEMGFINPEDYRDEPEEFKELAEGFTQALLKYPALSDVISLDETQVSIMANGDAIILFGDCACYVNWWGYEND